MDDYDDNIFDYDNALDYILSEDVEKEVNNPQRCSGCFGVLLLLIIPVFLVEQLVGFIL